MKILLLSLLIPLIFSCESESKTSVGNDTTIDFSFTKDFGNTDSTDIESDQMDANISGPFVYPETEAGAQAMWFFGLVNTDSSISPGEIEAHFTSDFLSQASATTLIDLIKDLRKVALWRPVGIHGDATEQVINLVIEDRTELTTLFSFQTRNAKISDFQGRKAPELGQFPKNWEALDATMDATAKRANILISEIVNGQCVDVHRHSNGNPFALGSIFKLYILDTWTQNVIAGNHQWNELIEVREELRSIASKDLDKLPNGQMVTARALANSMISVSDNTATDLLLRALGRKVVETQMATTHSDAARNVPLLSTRELFQLKVPNNVAEIDTYLAMGTSARRDFLNDVLRPRDLPSLAQARLWESPRYIEELEWFGTNDDLCTLMAKFQTRRKIDSDYQVAANALSLNPAGNYDDIEKQFPYVGYKGGSEPGVLTGVWLLERADGRTFVISLGLNDSKEAITFKNSRGVYYGAFQLINAIP